MPRLNLVSVDEKVLRASLDIMSKYALDPRDSIHAASAILCKADAIVSTDPHFDRVKELPRKQL